MFFYFFKVYINVMQNVTQMADRSQTSTGLSVRVYGGLHKVLTLSETVLLAIINTVTFL